MVSPQQSALPTVPNLNAMTSNQRQFLMMQQMRAGGSGNATNPPLLNTQTVSSPERIRPDQPPPKIPYLPRFAEEQKMDSPNLDTSTPYNFAPNSPLPPTVSTTSGSSSTMISPFHFPFPDNPVPSHRPDSNFLRHSTNGAELTLHGGTAQISVMGNNERYRMAASRRPINGPDPQPWIPTTPSSYNAQTASPDREKTEVESYHYTSKSDSPRAANSLPGPPPPAGPHIYSIPPVIKAEAFAALRRTKARQKRGERGFQGSHGGP